MLKEVCWFVEDYVLLSNLCSKLEIQLQSKIPMKLQLQDLPKHILPLHKFSMYISLETFGNGGFMGTDRHRDFDEVFEVENKPEPVAWERGLFWLLEDGTRLEIANEYPFYIDDTPNDKQHCILTTKTF